MRKGGSATAIFYIFLTGIKKQRNHTTQSFLSTSYRDILIFWGLTMVRWTKGMPFRTLILDVQNFGSVFLRSNFWYQRNLRCYWQSQMLHRKIRITLASEVFHKKILCFAKASEVFEGIVIFLLNVPHVFWYFQTQKEKVIDIVCLTSPCYNQLCSIISSIKMDCVCNMCSKRFPDQE